MVRLVEETKQCSIPDGVGRSEQLKAIADLKEHCSQRYEQWERDEIERLVDSL
jgi:hypothetical protein